MKVEPWSIVIDASNDTGLYGMFLVMVRLFDIDFN